MWSVTFFRKVSAPPDTHTFSVMLSSFIYVDVQDCTFEIQKHDNRKLIQLSKTYRFVFIYLTLLKINHSKLWLQLYQDCTLKTLITTAHHTAFTVIRVWLLQITNMPTKYLSEVDFFSLFSVWLVTKPRNSHMWRMCHAQLLSRVLQIVTPKVHSRHAQY